MALIGYCRVSTSEQNSELQTDALTKAGCERIFSDIASGSKAERPGLIDALQYARSGDTIVVWRLDRLGRSLKHLLDLINDFKNRNIQFQSIQENLDTSTTGGQLVFHVFAALAEFEHSLIRDRTNAGLKAAQDRGHFGGRPKVFNDEKVKRARSLMMEYGLSAKEISRQFGISRATLYRYLSKSSISLP